MVVAAAHRAHSLASVKAMRMGKPVYWEKPLLGINASVMVDASEWQRVDYEWKAWLS